MSRLVFLGAGKMAQAIVVGLLQAQSWDAEEIVGVGRSDASRQSFLSHDPQLTWTSDWDLALNTADVVVLCLKPQQFSEALPKLKAHAHGKLWISIAAGIGLQRMQTELGHETRLVRAMPNTPVMVGHGVTAYCLNPFCTEHDEHVVSKIFSAVGLAYKVDEPMIEVVTALSGSGPAYVYQFVEHLSTHAQKLGLDAEVAHRMAVQTVLGAGLMLKETELEPQQLIAQVKSKGGTTEAALNTFEALGWSHMVAQAMDAAVKRSRELA